MTGDPCISLWVREERVIRTFTLSEWVARRVLRRVVLRLRARPATRGRPTGSMRCRLIKGGSGAISSCSLVSLPGRT